MLDEQLSLGDRRIGVEHPPYVIAEIGSNFDQSMDTARRLIDACAEAGADAVKFQLFRADFLYPDGGELHDIFRSIELDPEWVPTLHQHASGQNVHFMASAFDRGSVEVLEKVDVVAHKIASSETTDLAFVAHVAALGRPVFLSTGMCDLVDVAEAVHVSIEAGNPQLALLQCGAVYPLDPSDANLRVLDTYRAAFGGVVGLSDHTVGIDVAIAAAGRGASVFEKHVTLDRTSSGPDHFFAAEPDELAALVRGVRRAYEALGVSTKTMLSQEREVGRREGLWLTADVAAGKPVAGNVQARRPAHGIRARQGPAVEHARTRRALEAGTPLRWDDIEP